MPRRRLRAAEIDTTTRKLKEVFAALAPWRGNAEALAQASVPDEAETAELRRRLAESEALRRQALDLLAAKTREAERLKVEAAAARAADLLGDEAAAEIRSARDVAWVAHRTGLDRASADVFEAAMRRDDVAGATRVARARELAALRERAIKLAGVELEREHAKADLEAQAMRSRPSSSRSRRLRPSRRRKGGTRLPSSMRGGLSATRR